MINYIIQIILFQLLFLAVYDFFLRKETFFKWNRLYLIGTSVLSFIIPLIRFESIKKVVSQEYIVLLPKVVFNPQVVIEKMSNSVAMLSYLNLLFYIGLCVFLILFLLKLYKISRLIISNRVIKKENFTLILLENGQSAFSFFHYIFIDKALVEKVDSQIIQHELVHSKQLHSIDLLFFEFFKIIMWFNPMIYIYQKRITVLHEYISDAVVVKETDKKQYFNTLLAETFHLNNISFINQFYKHSLIEKRIIMITKNKSQKIKQLKYLVLIPILFSMLFYVSCADGKLQTIGELEDIIEDVVEVVSSKVIALRPPVFPGCKGTIVELRKCLNKSIRMHIIRKFNKDLANTLGLKLEKKYISVQFKITKDGSIKILKVRAPHPALKAEVKRVINLLPKMEAGSHQGKKVNVTYMLPIVVNLK